REPDLGRHAEALENPAPLRQERAEALRAGFDERAARRMVNDGTRGLGEKAGRLLAPLVQRAVEALTVEQLRVLAVAPAGAFEPVALRRERREELAVRRAAERDVAVRHREDVRPEPVARTVLAHRFEIFAEPLAADD